MNNKTTLLIIVLAFALLIGGASILYNGLGQEQTPDQLVVLPTKPSILPVQPTEPTSQPVELPTQSTEPPTQPTDPATQPTEPATQPTEPATQPTEPATQPTEPPTQPTEPPTQPTEPPTQPTQPPTQPTQPTEPPRPQLSVPDFVVYDAGGNPVRLSDFAGKPIVLNFWASWCGPCQMEMPHFQEKYGQWGDEVVFLMVNVTGYDSKSDAMDFIQRGGYTFPVFFDQTLDASNAYGVHSFPTTFFINANGDLVTYAIGAISASTLQRAIDMIR